ncbi:MAG: peptide chain release factor 1 [Magnetococcales bacterium]|nr:peptide chain release factor 1 [Magnetococcales bacterium]NGZ25297.1 peptide chain release factor 1 [Magnetococcales bacterium]
MNFLHQLETMSRRHGELTAELSRVEVMSDNALFTRLSREYAELTPVVEAFQHYQEGQKQLAEATAMASDEENDPELRQMAREEQESLQQQLAEQHQHLQHLLLPKDPNDEKNVILEIRAGTGGDEAGLFAADLFRMYTRFAEVRGWKVEHLSSTTTPLGGFKEIICMITGSGAYSVLKFESGAHRVQRVPVTEAGGRIHTSACTVAVLPEADEVEVRIDEKDIRVDVYRSSGPGGQSVNTTDSAVRLTHIPSGLVVICQDEKSQHRNKAKAMKVLQARLLDLEQQAAHDERSQERRNQVGSGDRSERIRTYNFPQSRLTDHRINLTLYKLEQVLQGDLDEIVLALAAQHQAELLAQAGITG